MKRVMMMVAWAAAACTAQAQQQRQVVVLDAVTREPVARASLYTKEGGRFHAAISDEQGVARVAFDFRRLTVSHLNYEALQLRQMGDTIWLRPRYRQTAEVVVTNQEPEWIRRKLREVVRRKEQHYFAKADTMGYRYETESIGRNSLYRYRQRGLISLRNAEEKHYAIRPDSSAIAATDSTSLTDVANLRRMLCEDFMAELTKGFISSHRWAENTDYEGRGKDVVELVFRSRHRSDDRGRLVVDTARCVVLQAYRITGTETNCHERMPAVLYAMAKVLSGYRVLQWNRHYRVMYGERPDGTLFPEWVGYKFYMETQDADNDEDTQEYERQTGGGFPNMEATLQLEPATAPLTDTGQPFLQLPASWYLRYSTEESRQQEVVLANLPSAFTLL